jgi:hypothetical protein
MLLASMFIVYFKPLVLGSTVNSTCAGLFVAGVACLWLASEIKRTD